MQLWRFRPEDNVKCPRQNVKCLHDGQGSRSGLETCEGKEVIERLIGRLIVAALSLSLCGCISVTPVFTGRVETVLVEESPRWFETNRIALIDVDGFIASTERPWYAWSGTTLADVKEKLRHAAGDWRVRAVVLRINSPGGEASASDMIYREILRFRRKTGKPVVAELMGTAASGGYYAALAADRIVASPTSVTGSVGVIMEFINVEGLFGKIGLRNEVVKSGGKKDIGSPLRAMTEEEREILEGVNRSLFDRFMAAVKSRRPGMTEKDLATVADGRIVSADQALGLHMVDSIGYLDDALAEARALAGISGADVILYRAFPHYNTNIYARHQPGAGLVEQGLERLLQRNGPTFLYLWSPGR